MVTELLTLNKIERRLEHLVLLMTTFVEITLLEKLQAAQEKGRGRDHPDALATASRIEDRVSSILKLAREIENRTE